jgi:hypothetical protein
MEIFQLRESKKLAEAYRAGHITLTEFIEELEWCWDMKIYRGTRVPTLERTGGPIAAILEEHG